MNDNTSLLTISEFASALRIQPSCVRRWIREEKITVVHVGRLVRVPSTEVQRLIREGTRQARGSQTSNDAL